MAKIISVEPKEKYYQVTLEVQKTPLEPDGKIEVKVWNSDTDLIQKLKLNSEIEGVIANTKYGKVINEITVIKEGRLGLSKDEQESKFELISNYLSEIAERTAGTNEHIWKQAGCIWALLKEYEHEFKNAPAAKGHHHNYVGGLLQHTFEVLSSVPSDNDIAVMGAILHDFGKIWEYKNDLETGIIEHNEEFGKSLGLAKDRDNKIYSHILWGYNWCIERGFKELAHIVGSHHNSPEWGSIFKPATPEAHMVFIADYKSSHLGSLTVADLPEEVAF